VYDILNWIPWSGSIHGFPLELDMTYLSQFMTMEWLTSEHVDMMMDLLRQDVFVAGLGSKVELVSESAMLILKIKQAYE
jgi:hypothetical protein